MRMLVTGGLGFIGSNFIRHILSTYPEYTILNVDKMTYAGNPDNLKDLEKNSRYEFIKADIIDQRKMIELAKTTDVIINFAAESHVDRSIQDPTAFLQTGVLGVYSLIEASRAAGHQKYIQISTDEVYGDQEGKPKATETSPLEPSSPYSAAKAAGELLVLAAHRTYGFPGIITRCTNNYGPYCYPEKMISLFITNAIEDQPLPLYGDGQQIRDWLYVEDHCRAIDLVLHQGKAGEVYNVSADQNPEITNEVLAKRILQMLGKPADLIKPVQDRPGHDRRYALDSSKIRALGWKPARDFEQGLRETIEWYQHNPAWWKKIKSGEYQAWYKKQYGF